jgi:hypothetical protein
MAVVFLALHSEYLTMERLKTTEVFENGRQNPKFS